MRVQTLFAFFKRKGGHMKIELKEATCLLRMQVDSIEQTLRVAESMVKELSAKDLFANRDVFNASRIAKKVGVSGLKKKSLKDL